MAPTHPPTSNRPSRIGITTLAAAVGLFAIVLATRPNLSGGTVAPTPSPPAAVPGTTPIAVLPSASETSAVLTPTASAAPSSSKVPNGGCSADQFTLGTVIPGPGGSTFGTESVYVLVQITNNGSECVLRIPATILVASSDAADHSVALSSAMTTATYVSRAGRTFTAVIGAWWPSSGAPQIPKCKVPVMDIRSVSVGLPAGRFDITLDRSWPQACSSPATVSLEYK